MLTCCRVEFNWNYSEKEIFIYTVFVGEFSWCYYCNKSTGYAGDSNVASMTSCIQAKFKIFQ